MKKTVLIFLFLMLTACGFHLRGETFLPPGLNTLYVEGPVVYNSLTAALQQTIHSMGVSIASNVKDAQVTLQILTQSFSQQLINISPNTLVNTYRLEYLVTLQLLNRSGAVIYGPFTVKTESSYAISDKQILGDTSFLASKQQEMRRDAIALIFNRLSAMDARTAIENTLS